MEKRVPHYALDQVKDLIRSGAFRVTRTAMATATRDFGFVAHSQLVDVVLALTVKHFYKSMTTQFDTSIWQDVYHGLIGESKAYIKLQIVNGETVVISFKDLGHG